jgi:hypothetical protein
MEGRLLMRGRLGRLLALGLGLALLARASLADYVVLKSGDVIEGEVAENDETVTVKMRGGTLRFARSAVARVGRGDPREDASKAAPGRTRASAASEGPRLAAKDREAIVRRNIQARAKAKDLIGTFASPDPGAAASALREIVAMEPFPVIVVAASLDDPRPAVRRGAARALGAAGGRAGADALVRAALRDRDESVRRTAAKIIGGMEDGVAISRLVSCAARAKGERAVQNAADAVRFAGNKAAVGALISYAVMEIRLTVTGNARMNEASINGWTNIGDTGFGALDFPIQMPSLSVTKLRTAASIPALAVLTRVTGVDHGGDVAAWAKWWRENHEVFIFGDDARGS